MKLGLIIKITNGGEGEAYAINKNESWAQYAVDARSPIKTLANFDATEKTVYFAKFLGSIGYLFCVIKARPEGSGRPFDNTAAWIFVPTGLNISSADALQVIQGVEEAISEKNGIDYKKLETIFNAEFPSTNVMASVSSTIGFKNEAPYAVRYYNADFSLKELIGSAIAQTEYAQYKSIFFIDKSLGITTNNVELKFEPKPVCTIMPPQETDGFVPCLLSQGKYHKFTQPIELTVGQKLPVYWIKPGFSNIVKNLVASTDPRCVDAISIRATERKNVIERSSINVVSTEGRPIPDAIIRIDGKQMVGNSIEVSESAMKKGVNLYVTANGYAVFQKDNVIINKNLMIKLPRKQLHYEFSIPVYDGKQYLKDAILTVDTNRHFQKSPIEGYETIDPIQVGEGYTNKLCLKSGFFYKFKHFAFGFLTCLIGAFIYIGVSQFNKYMEPTNIDQITNETENSVTEGETLESTQTTPDSTLLAIDYLDRNTLWHKDSLEQYPATKDLFDNLNAFAINQLEQRTDLMGSQQFAEVYEALKKSKEEGIDPSVGKEVYEGKYNAKTDKGIDIKRYIDWVKVQHKKDVPQSEPTPKKENKSVKSTQQGKTQAKTVKAPAKAQPKPQPATSGSEPKKTSSGNQSRGGV